MATTPNGYLSEAVRNKANNILTHGKIESLPFGGKGIPFRIILLRKSMTPPITYTNQAIFVDCKLRGDSAESPFFIFKDNMSVGEWTKQTITKVSDTEHNDEVMTKYDIYWAAGEDYPN